MSIGDIFTYSKGSVIGSTHRNNFKNNQDYSFVISEDSCVVALVGDGCGSGMNSEVGSKLIIPTLASDIAQFIRLGEPIEKAIQQSLSSAQDFMYILSQRLPMEFSEGVEHYFLFTIIGAVITHDETIIFSMGDGVYSINGSIHIIDQNNAPNYLGYTIINKKDPEFSINVKMPTEAVESILIASDGATDIIKNKDRSYKLGLKMKQVGDLTQFNDDIYKDDTGSIKMTKLLNVFSKQNIVSDDTTIISINRAPKGE